MWAGDTDPTELTPLNKDLKDIADKVLILDGGTEMVVPDNDDLYTQL